MSTIARDLQRKLNFPLPEAVTAAERDHALVLFGAAIDRLKIDSSDTAGLDDLKEYADGLHAKYN